MSQQCQNGPREAEVARNTLSVPMGAQATTRAPAAAREATEGAGTRAPSAEW